MKSFMFHTPACRLGWFIFSFFLYFQIQTAWASPYQLEISKTSQVLLVKDDNNIIKRYRIAFGKGGKGTKRRLGDNKTPVGSYRIVDFKQESKFHYFMQLSYPNLLDAWHGYRNELISAQEFRQIASAYKQGRIPPQNTALGGYIGIHGIGELTDEKLEIHALHNWTEGCIALNNHEINELRRYVSIGTRVLIRK